MASLWKHPNSEFWTACYTDKDGKQVKRSTKQTKRAKALVIALELERVEQQARRGTVSTLQIQKVFNDLVEKTTGDTIMTPSVEKYLKEWLTNVKAKNSEATAERYRHTVDLFFKCLEDKKRLPMTGITSAHIEDFLSWRLKQNVAPKTASVDIVTLSVAFHRAERYGVILKNPVTAVDPPKAVSSEREPFMDDDVKKLLDTGGYKSQWFTLIMMNEDIYSLIEAAELDPEQEAKLECELSRQYHILTRDDRLETVARDIVRHFLGRGFVGKAMVVSLDKATALKMHDKVRKHWAVERERVERELGRYGLPADEKDELLDRLRILQTTDMALIVSPGQNEIAQMQARGLDIVPHRRRMNGSQPPLDEKFKAPEDSLRLVFVCAMWMTGFDAPSCSTMYLDKPLRNHTLMQTIARANRVFPGKQSGVIVDYANVFASLEKALAIYGAGKNGKNPVRDKQKLVEELRKAVDAAVLFCANRGVVLAAIEQLPTSSMERLQRMDEAVNALISPDPLRREFFGHERLVSALYGAVKPDPAALEFAGRVACVGAIAEAIRTTLNPNPADISGVMGGINQLLDASITGVGMPANPAPVMDLSKIDFEALRRRFKESRHRNTDLEILKAAIRAQLEKLIRLNKTRTDFQEKFEELVESYNAGSRNIEELFEELVKLSRNLSEEQQRHVRENMTEEELVIFDILTRPAPELSTEERTEVKKVARELLNRLKQLLVINWRQKSVARAQLRLAIEDVLDTGLPRIYSPELYQQKCSAVFEHVYESYPERDAETYALSC